MKKTLQNPWILSFLAGGLYLFSTAAALYVSLPRWMPAPPEPELPERHPYALESALGFNSQAMEQLVEDLNARGEELDRREQELQSLAEVLEGERDQLKQARSRLEQQEERLESLIFTYRETEATQLKKLVDIYAQMEPTLVVEVLNEFNEDKVVKILQLMNPELVKDIFETMLASADPESDQALRVAYLSQQLTRTFREDALESAREED